MCARHGPDVGPACPMCARHGPGVGPACPTRARRGPDIVRRRPAPILAGPRRAAAARAARQAGERAGEIRAGASLGHRVRARGRAQGNGQWGMGLKIHTGVAARALRALRVWHTQLVWPMPVQCAVVRTKHMPPTRSSAESTHVNLGLPCLSSFFKGLHMVFV